MLSAAASTNSWGHAMTLLYALILTALLQDEKDEPHDDGGRSEASASYRWIVFISRLNVTDGDVGGDNGNEDEGDDFEVFCSYKECEHDRSKQSFLVLGMMSIIDGSSLSSAA